MARIALDRYVLDVLMRDLTGHERKPSAFIVYLYLWYRTFGTTGRGARISLQKLAEGTGLSKSAVQSALKLLLRRRLIRVERGAPTSVPEYFVYHPWASRRQMNL